MNRLDSYGQVMRFLGEREKSQMSRRMVVSSREIRKPERGVGSWNTVKFGRVEFEMPVGHQGGYVQHIFSVARLDLRRELRAR